MDLSGLQLTESMLASMLSHSLDDDDLWNVETILGMDATNMLELEKDLQFLDATSAPPTAAYNGLQIQTDNLNFLPDAIMDQVFATEPCYSPEPKPRPR
ncbi:hypothetical protein SDRG_08399 [Saprolegnia diclina VS20]|uniref:Uncharacterized protein n=1 Tax=Saprolegnia diclina (strain VS20) TaxID=1156394 RepID=T0QK99_SAPDV|nr:hypothetical protein SDRG_08399 [Saprolegnia diclina VS20]EQC34195.1 hypothetical protein SDRG_08399 [Saprolegnia diclina VS20]|eukprot:XP_008612507.1 hypothetical protein SDRG_08399 [Saprolegnia diclina VS20]